MNHSVKGQRGGDDRPSARGRATSGLFCGVAPAMLDIGGGLK
jgi:hypothetical protein